MTNNPMRLPRVGEVFEGRYELVGTLGEGSFGHVYRANDTSMHRVVALKILSPNEEGYRQLTAARFVREARLLAQLQDPHTLTLYDFGETSAGLLYTATEFIDGEDLRTILNREGRLPPNVVVHILKQVLSSLREAHGRELLHRDIKPANIIVYPYEGDDYRIKLLDFGLAKSVSVDATELTGAGRIAGTPRYMSPEQVLTLKLTAASDIYSLGLVAYEMLVGSPAVDGETMRELLQEQVKGPPIIVPEQYAEPRLRRLIERMTQRTIADRPPTAQAVLNVLQGWSSSSMVPTHPAPSSDSQVEWRAPEPSPATTSWPVVIAGVAALVLVAGIAVALRPATPEPRETPSLDKVLEAQPPARLPVAEPTPIDAPRADGDSVPNESGCALRPPAKAGLGEYLQDGELWRREILHYVPSSYRPHRPTPLIIVLPDKPSAMTKEFEQLDLRATADRQEFVVAWLDDETWEEDLDLMLDRFCIDESRVYLVGHLINERPIRAARTRKFAAMATVSARTAVKDKLRRAWVPRIDISGKQDNHTPLEGGPPGAACDDDKVHLSWADHVDVLREAHQCDKPTSWENGIAPAGVCRTHGCDIELVTCLHDEGRYATRPDPNPKCGGEPPDFSIPDLLWDFFRRYTRSDPPNSTK